MNTETGEVIESSSPCPLCAVTEDAAEIQVHGMELERRKDRAALTRMRNEMEAAEVGRRDKALWQELLDCWLLAFPDKKPTAKGIKSARATAVFQRIERGAMPEDIKNAIAGAMVFRYVVYGRRVANGSRTDDGSDLADIVSPDNDRNFDFLAEEGAKLRQPTSSAATTA